MVKLFSQRIDNIHTFCLAIQIGSSSEVVNFSGELLLNMVVLDLTTVEGNSSNIVQLFIEVKGRKTLIANLSHASPHDYITSVKMDGIAKFVKTGNGTLHVSGWVENKADRNAIKKAAGVKKTKKEASESTDVTSSASSSTDESDNENALCVPLNQSFLTPPAKRSRKSIGKK